MVLVRPRRAPVPAVVAEPLPSQSQGRLSFISEYDVYVYVYVCFRAGTGGSCSLLIRVIFHMSSPGLKMNLARDKADRQTTDTVLSVGAVERAVG